VDRVVLAGRPEVVQTRAPSRVRGMTFAPVGGRVARTIRMGAMAGGTVALVTAIDRLF